MCKFFHVCFLPFHHSVPMECVTASTIFIPSLHTVSSLITDASHIHCFLSHLFACLFLSFSFHLSTSISLWFTNQTGSTGYSPWTNYKPSLLRNCSCLCVVSSLPVGHTVTCLTTLNPSLDTQKKGKSTT